MRRNRKPFADNGAYIATMQKWYTKGGRLGNGRTAFFNTKRGEGEKMAKTLNKKQRDFADHFIECGNQTEAAERAGYSKRSARQVASQLMQKPLIKQYIEERMASKNPQLIASQDEILAFLTATMRGEVTEQVPLLDGDGYQKLATLDAAQPKDRLKAAELLGKRYAMWTDKKDLTGTVGVVLVDDTGVDDDEE